MIKNPSYLKHRTGIYRYCCFFCSVGADNGSYACDVCTRYISSVLLHN